MAKHRPGDRVAMETALPGECLSALGAICSALGVARDRWHVVPSVARVFEAVAVVGLVERFRGEGLTVEAAIRTAAMRLGLEEETAKSRAKRWATYGVRRAA